MHPQTADHTVPSSASSYPFNRCADVRPDDQSHLISSFSLGHRPYMSPRLLAQAHVQDTVVSRPSSTFYDPYLHSTYSGQQSMDFFLDVRTDTYDDADSSVFQSLAYPESSQRTLLPESPYVGMYDATPRRGSGPALDQIVTRGMTEEGVDENIALSTLELQQTSFGCTEEYAIGISPVHQRASEGASSRANARNMDLRYGIYHEYETPPKNMGIGEMVGMFQVDSSVTQQTSSSLSPYPSCNIETLQPILHTFQLSSDSFDEIEDPKEPSSMTSFSDSEEDSDEEDESPFDDSHTPASPEMLRSLENTGPTRTLSFDNSLRNWAHSSATLAESSLGMHSDTSSKDESISPTPSNFEPDSPTSNPPSFGRSISSTSISTMSSSVAGTQKKSMTKKKSKMHQCGVCHKWFPRPSGLKTHMNSHSGEKPYRCTVPNCNKSFAVRSNAKRHLRTHGIVPMSEPSGRPASRFTVGFETPMISSSVHEMTKIPPKLKWIPQSLQTRTNIAVIQRESSVEEEDETDEDRSPSPSPLLPIPLPAVVPSLSGWNLSDDFEERDSYASLERYPYHPSQWRGLPGPAAIPPTGVH